jgi:hypothetical protein
MEPHKAAKPMVWVKDQDGNVYVCPKDALKDPKGFSEEELKTYCIDDSTRPDNF